MDSAVADGFARFPPEARTLELRALLFETAQDHPEVGVLTETLKWGEPRWRCRCRCWKVATGVGRSV
jgi:hypothetical protein